MTIGGQIINSNFGIEFLPKNTTSHVVLLHGRLNNVHIQDWFIFISTQLNSYEWYV